MSALIVSTTQRLRHQILALALLAALLLAAVAGPLPTAHAQGPAPTSAAHAAAVAASRDRYHTMKQAQFERHAGAVKSRTLVTPSLARLRYEDMKDRTYLRRVP